jgi:predicted nucleotidyltransferase component of viral defense system
MIDSTFYFDTLYPLQDQVLQIIRMLDTDFYLSGGTADSRGYLRRRFSDDLDLFVNDDPRFGLWADRVIQALVLLREDQFTRANLVRGQV